MLFAKKKILFISDHPLSCSGVGVQSRFLINGLIKTGKYSFRCLGAAIKHENHNLVKVSDDFFVKPIEGFGNQEMIRSLLLAEKPDAIVLFTDPRFFNHIFLMHDEIHQICPIVYNHLWDDSGNHPPAFNKVIYDICDVVNCINWPTYEFSSKHWPNKTNYIPHAVPDDMYFKLPQNEKNKWREKVVGKERLNHFVPLFVGRNARRKRTSDVLASWRLFLNDLKNKHGHQNATLVMHTNPFDQEGPNLGLVLDHFDLNDHVIFSNNLIEFEQMNGLYNAVDCTVNISCNEGFGLPILESKMAETPCISIMTGGLTRQIKDHETGYEFGIALKPDVETIVGNQGVPWIAEDFVSNQNVANAFMKIYEMSNFERAEIGKRAREHCLKNYNISNLVNAWEQSLDKLFSTWSNSGKRWEKIEI